MKQDLYTNKMEETRGGVLEAKADNSTMKYSILPEGPSAVKRAGVGSERYRVGGEIRPLSKVGSLAVSV